MRSVRRRGADPARAAAAAGAVLAFIGSLDGCVRPAPRPRVFAFAFLRLRFRSRVFALAFLPCPRAFAFGFARVIAFAFSRLGFGVCVFALLFGVWGFAFGVWGLAFRVWGFAFGFCLWLLRFRFCVCSAAWPARAAGSSAFLPPVRVRLPALLLLFLVDACCAFGFAPYCVARRLLISLPR